MNVIITTVNIYLLTGIIARNKTIGFFVERTLILFFKLAFDGLIDINPIGNRNIAGNK